MNGYAIRLDAGTVVVDPPAPDESDWPKFDALKPAKIILTGVCFYLVPLYIVSIGNTSAMAGRMLMVYAVMMVLIVPLSASLSDATLRRDRYVSIGLVISGLTSNQIVV